MSAHCQLLNPLAIGILRYVKHGHDLRVFLPPLQNKLTELQTHIPCLGSLVATQIQQNFPQIVLDNVHHILIVEDVHEAQDHVVCDRNRHEIVYEVLEQAVQICRGNYWHDAALELLSDVSKELFFLRR